MPFLNELLLLFRYLANSGVAVLNGVPSLRQCATRFVTRAPTWFMPSVGHVADLITEGGEDVGLVHVAPFADVGSGAGAATGGAGGLWAVGPGGRWK